MKRNKSFDESRPLIYLISSPIGNLGEFNSRAIEVISSCTLVAAEDTRNTSSLLAKFNIKKPTFSLREHNEKGASEYLISKVLEGEKVVYLSDAGYPGISDPGYILTKECIAHDINVSVINGSSAFLTALVASGLDTNHFYFHGFLPAKSNEAIKELETLKAKEETLIFYESPHRIKESLNNFYSVLGDRNICLARELTKINEEYIRGTLKEFIDIDESTLKGEIVIIIEGNKENKDTSEEELLEAIKLLKEKSLSNRDIIEVISKLYKINKNKISKLIY